MLITLDSSVIVAALRQQEPEHLDCIDLLSEVEQGRHYAVEPFTVLVEVVAAIRRRTGSEALAERVQRSLLSFPHIQYVELDRHRAAAAAEVARVTGVRGMDAIVVAVAREFETTLVTLDADMGHRVQGLVTVTGARDVVRTGDAGATGAQGISSTDLARRLARLGGSESELEAPPRRRPESE